MISIFFNSSEGAIEEGECFNSVEHMVQSFSSFSDIYEVASTFISQSLIQLIHSFCVSVDEAFFGHFFLRLREILKTSSLETKNVGGFCLALFSRQFLLSDSSVVQRYLAGSGPSIQLTVISSNFQVCSLQCSLIGD